MSIDSYFNTTIYIKRKTGIDMYGKPIYSSLTTKAKVEERLEKYLYANEEKLVSLTTFYTKDEIKNDDLISVDGVNYFPVLSVETIRYMNGAIAYYKSYSMRGSL
jgi:hypothetical protein